MTDAPDDFDYSQVGEFTANLDSGELAARLYSPTTYARTGQVLFMTDFSRGFAGMFVNDTSPTATGTLVSNYSISSGLAAKLYTTYTDDSFISLTNTLPFVAAKYYTIDLGFVNEDGNGIFHGYLLVVYEGIQHTIEFEYTFNTFKLRVKNSANAWVDITALESSSSYFGGLAHLRITIDIEAGLFKSLTLNSVEFTVSNIEYLKPAVANYNNVGISLYYAKESGVSSTMYLSWIVVSLSDV